MKIRNVENAHCDSDRKAPPGCPNCWQGHTDLVRVPKFVYRGSVVGPFVIENALVVRCPQCALIAISPAEAMRWETQRAFEISIAAIGTNVGITGNEFRLIRSVMRLSLDSLAKLLGVNRSTIFRWEQNGATVQAGKQLCWLYIANVLAASFPATQRGSRLGGENVEKLLKELIRLAPESPLSILGSVLKN